MVQKKECYDMGYLLTFLEGLASFISPCMLPMIPLYLSYFAGDDESEEESQTTIVDTNTEAAEVNADSAISDGNEETAAENIGQTTEEVSDGEEGKSVETVADTNAEKTAAEKKPNVKKYRVLIMSLFFVFGFTLMFVVFGGLVGLVSGYVAKYKKIINIVAGGIVVIFGLSYIGLFRLPFFKGITKSHKIKSVWSAFLFGIVFAVGVGPCTGAFLGSALALASTSGTVAKGIALLLCYSLGIGIPFIVTAILTDKTKKLFGFIKRHFKVIKIISGSLLVVIGILMATGVMDKLGAIIK